MPRQLALLAALVVSCSGRDLPRPAAIDPWMVSASPDDPPDFATTRALADKACPAVVAPYFFRVEKAGQISHILGTRHIGVSLAKMPAVVRDQIRSARLAVFETPIEDDSGPLPGVDGPSLADQLGPALWARYRGIAGRAAAVRVEHGRPSDAIISLIALYEDKTAALDVEIEHEVTTARIPTDGLETHTFQQQLILELMDVRMLRATLAGTPDRAALEREAVEDLHEYCAGTDDEPGFDQETRSQLKAGGLSDAEIDRLDDKLVFSRNRDWIPKLEEMFASGGVFVAVGADHLTGKRGVIALLAARGWKTTRVRP
jgi:uncharacterized protein YbaP (TraB family)